MVERSGRLREPMVKGSGRLRDPASATRDREDAADIEAAAAELACRGRDDDANRLRTAYGQLTEPPAGWRAGLEALVRGRCPWCDRPIQNPHVNAPGLSGLRWSCFDGCNP
jgi:hypothetical protein